MSDTASHLVVVNFAGAEAFDAYNAAVSFLDGYGFSVGRMQGPDPVGVKFGRYDIQKWRNLRELERVALDGRITGDKRNGPVTVIVAAPTAEIASAMRAAIARAEGRAA